MDGRSGDHTDSATGTLQSVLDRRASRGDRSWRIRAPRAPDCHGRRRRSGASHFIGARTMKQIVVITGASAGVGRATVRAFAQHGADIALLARGDDGLEGARREVQAKGGRALVLPTDVADADQVEAA